MSSAEGGLWDLTEKHEASSVDTLRRFKRCKRAKPASYRLSLLGGALVRRSNPGGRSSL